MLRHFKVVSLVAAGIVASTGFASASSIGPFAKVDGEAAEIAAAISYLDNAGVDTTGFVALGKLESFTAGLNIETEGYGLGLDATLSDLGFDGLELKSFDMGLNSVAGYKLTAVLIKAGQNMVIYYDNMFDDMTTSLLSNKGVSHISYFGTEMTPVPLPASSLLLLAGLGGFAALKRRK